MNETEKAVSGYPAHMARAFRELRSGKHLCVEDGETYQDIRRHEAQYKAVLSAIGYQLVQHPQNFYYLRGGSTLNSKGIKSITVFLLILFQHLEDHKFDSEDRSWERELINRTFKIAELPHFATSASRELMRSLDLTSENLRKNVLRLMSRLGIIEFAASDGFVFRAPVYRFVDLCIGFSTRDVSDVELLDEGESRSDKGKVSGVVEVDDDEIWEDVDDVDSDEEPH